MSETDINKTVSIRTAKAGNGLAAANLIPSGSLILKISDPYLILLEKAQLQSTCSWCFKKPEPNTMKHCGGCRILRYCSPDCQKQDWQAIHRKECKILKALPDVPPTPTRGLIQLSLRHKFGNDLDPRWEGLVTNEEKLRNDKERFDQLSLQAVAAIKYSGRGGEWMYIGIKVLYQVRILFLSFSKYTLYYMLTESVLDVHKCLSCHTSR